MQTSSPAGARRPRIGIPVRLSSSADPDPRVAEANGLFDYIVDLVRDGGGEPVLLTPELLTPELFKGGPHDGGPGAVAPGRLTASCFPAAATSIPGCTAKSRATPATTSTWNRTGWTLRWRGRRSRPDSPCWGSAADTSSSTFCTAARSSRTWHRERCRTATAPLTAAGCGPGMTWPSRRDPRWRGSTARWRIRDPEAPGPAA